MRLKFTPILSYLEHSMKELLSGAVYIDLRIYDSYEAGRQALVNGEFDIGRIGPASYLIAKQVKPDIILLAMQEHEWKLTFQGVIFTREKSGISSLQDLKDRIFIFGDKNSTIGGFLAELTLRRAGVFPDLQDYEYVPGHDKVVEAVLGGIGAAGAAKLAAFWKKEHEGLKLIRIYPPIIVPTMPWVGRSGLDDAVVKYIQESLFSLKDPEILGAIGGKLTGFSLLKW